ncbi:Putative F0F1-ATPase subunit (ATPase_gene1) [Polystyrenella longa]|uniref:F0F1-ATPase subunit (ATPase_gene1) n=1 Tax=Polystyrenella longa TaxID=2528007 RepID=A0A518CHN9_9PLAN|nr:AtpZ/AtpI family protein [Polystyrenella longa]QDU78748.1 Putative F0F1-ATPase subunit (ATPase_gene1) [Polystyrenella longa]
MKRPPDKKPPMVAAMQVANEVSTIGMSFALPPLGGYWLDWKLGTSPWLVLVGAALGFVVGMKMIFELTKRLGNSNTSNFKPNGPHSKENRSSQNDSSTSSSPPSDTGPSDTKK